MSEISRRHIAEGANGIGSWLPIMEFMSFVCIPINIAIIYFAANGPGTDSQIIKTLDARDDYWTDLRILMLVIGIEHAVMILKSFLSVAVPDVPDEVISEEFKRDKTEELAHHSLILHKMETKSESFDDVVVRLQKEAAEELSRA